MHTEALDVVIRIVERMDLQFAGIAGTGIHLADGKATPETPVDGALYLLAKDLDFRIAWPAFGNATSLPDLFQNSQHGLNPFISPASRMPAQDWCG